MTEDVLNLVNGWAEAEQSNDSTRLDRFLAPDFVGVGAAGFVLDRGQWLKRFGQGLENRSFAVEDAQVHEHGPAAIVVGVVAQQTQFGGVDNSGRFRLTLAAIRTDDRWLVASVHIGPLQGGR